MRRAVALLALTASLAAAGCGGNADPDAAANAGPGTLGTRPGKLTCTEWRDGTVGERLGTIEQLTTLAAGNANPQDVGPNRTLSADDAYTALETTCSRRLARGFLLYEVYNRAAAFTPSEP